VSLSHNTVNAQPEGIAEDQRFAIHIVGARSLDFVANQVTFGAAAADSVYGLWTHRVLRVVVADSAFIGTAGFPQSGLRIGEATDFDASVVDSRFEESSARIYEQEVTEGTHAHVRFSNNTMRDDSFGRQLELEWIEGLLDGNTLAGDGGRLLSSRGSSLRLIGNVMTTHKFRQIFDLSGGDTVMINNAFSGSAGLMRTGDFVAINNSFQGIVELGNATSPGLGHIVLVNNSVRHQVSSANPCYFTDYADGSPTVVMSHNNCDADYPLGVLGGSSPIEISFEDFDACTWSSCQQLTVSMAVDTGVDDASYLLSETSPLIDVGVDPSTVDGAEPVTGDIEGDERPLDGDGLNAAEWDIGADEYLVSE